VWGWRGRRGRRLLLHPASTQAGIVIIAVVVVKIRGIHPGPASSAGSAAAGTAAAARAAAAVHTFLIGAPLSYLAILPGTAAYVRLAGGVYNQYSSPSTRVVCCNVLVSSPRLLCVATY